MTYPRECVSRETEGPLGWHVGRVAALTLHAYMVHEPGVSGILPRNMALIEDHVVHIAFVTTLDNGFKADDVVFPVNGWCLEDLTPVVGVVIIG